jgi:hypothetical protein
MLSYYKGNKTNGLHQYLYHLKETFLKLHYLSVLRASGKNERLDKLQGFGLTAIKKLRISFMLL